MSKISNNLRLMASGPRACNDQTIGMDSEAAQFELNVMESVLVFNLHQSLKITNRVLKRFEDLCIRGVEANVEVCKSYVEESIGIITVLDPHVGYENATKIAKKHLKQESQFEIILRDNILSELEINRILNSFEMTNPGIAGKQIVSK